MMTFVASRRTGTGPPTVGLMADARGAGPAVGTFAEAFDAASTRRFLAERAGVVTEPARRERRPPEDQRQLDPDRAARPLPCIARTMFEPTR